MQGEESPPPPGCNVMLSQPVSIKLNSVVWGFPTSLFLFGA